MLSLAAWWVWVEWPSRIRVGTLKSGILSSVLLAAAAGTAAPTPQNQAALTHHGLLLRAPAVSTDSA